MAVQYVLRLVAGCANENNSFRGQATLFVPPVHVLLIPRSSCIRPCVRLTIRASRNRITHSLAVGCLEAGKFGETAVDAVYGAHLWSYDAVGEGQLRLLMAAARATTACVLCAEPAAIVATTMIISVVFSLTLTLTFTPTNMRIFAGRVGARHGPMMAASDKFEIDVIGEHSNAEARCSAVCCVVYVHGLRQSQGRRSICLVCSLRRPLSTPYLAAFVSLSSHRRLHFVSC